MPRKTVRNTAADTARSQSNNIPIDIEPKPKTAFTQKVKAIIEDERFRIVIGIVLLAVSAFMLISYISFFITGKSDYSLLEQASLTAEDRKAIRNMLGLPGARLSRYMVDGTFGLVSLLIALWTLVAGLKLLHATHRSLFLDFIKMTFWLVWGSVTLGFVELLVSWDSFFRLGGTFGKSTAQVLHSYIHTTGMTLLLLVILIIFLIVSDRQFLPRMQHLTLWLKERFKRKPKPVVEPEETKEDEPAGDEPKEEEEPTANEEQLADNEIVISIDGLTGNNHEEEKDIHITFEEPEIQEIQEIQENPEEPETPKTSENADLEIIDTGEIELKEDDPDYLLKKYGPYDPRKDLETYQFPPLSLLKVYDNETAPVIDQDEQQSNANRIVTSLRNYGIEIDSIKATVGPTVTLYEIVPKAGIRVSKIQSLENDIMMSLSATGIRIIAPMPGKGTIGIEVPNEKPQTVSMHSVIASKRFQEEKKMRLPIAYGRTITNEVFMFDLAKTPHLLVAGATGTGKSVAINAIITSLLYKKHPAELKLVMVDPKMVEFAPYKPLIRHYLAAMPDTDPNQIVITDCDKVINTLNSLVIEMENRYKLLMDAGVRNLEDYNDKFINRRLNPEKEVADTLHHQFLPYIVIIIDEYGDFIMQAGKQVETPIARLTQKARAVGMHMILATQRPSVNIVTGVIKANIPTRIALRTQSVIDSRTVLDAKGAEQLIGRGDSLYAGNASVTRIQCAFVDTPEVDKIVEHISSQQHYFEPYQLPEYVGEGGEGEALAPGSVDMKRLDPMFADVARYVVAKQEGSTSRLQRAFEIGYNRAGKLSDQLEAAGIVGPNKGPKGRDVLIQDMDALERLLEELK